MADYPLMDVGEVACDRPDDPHMFCSSGKLDGDIADVKRREQLDILHVVSLVLGEDQELCLASRKFYLVLSAIVILKKR